MTAFSTSESEFDGYPFDWEEMSAEAADDLAAVPYPEEARRHMTRLAGVLNFDPDDLAENRAGFLSPRQIAHLGDRIRGRFWGIMGVLSALAFVLLLAGFVVSPLLYMGAGGLMLLALGAAVFMRRDLDELPARVVSPATIRLGRISLVLRRLGSSDEGAYFTVENNRKLYADGFLYKVMRPNQDYRAYYVKLSRTDASYRIISMEPIGEWAADGDPYDKPKRGKPKRSLFRR